MFRFNFFWFKVLFIGILLFGVGRFTVLGFNHLQPLSCNSVNQIPQTEKVEFIFVSPKTKDCIFLFEGPPNTNLDMKLRSLTNAKKISWDDHCSNSTLRMYNYMEGNRVELDQMVCSEASVITDSNMGVVTSSLNDGSFVLEVRSLTKGSLTPSEIFGMLPPVDGARDFFSSGNFVPSPGPQSGWSPFRALPVYSPPPDKFRPNVQAPYSGKPTNFVDLTHNPSGPAYAAISSNVSSSTTNSATSSTVQVTLTETPYSSTGKTPTTTKGTTTYVEFHITNATEIAESKKI